MKFIMMGLDFEEQDGSNKRGEFTETSYNSRWPLTTWAILQGRGVPTKFDNHHMFSHTLVPPTASRLKYLKMPSSRRHVIKVNISKWE